MSETHDPLLVDPEHLRLVDRVAALQDRLSNAELTIGIESSDGQSGTGLIGHVRRNSLRISKLERTVAVTRGALVGISMFLTLLAIFFRGWLASLITELVDKAKT